MPLWLVITGLGITQIIGWGTTYYALGALSQDIAATTGWSKTLIFGAFSAALLLSGLISRRAGRLDRPHRRAERDDGGLAARGRWARRSSGSFRIPSPMWRAGWCSGVAMRLATYDAAFASLAQIAGAGARRAISYLTLFGGLASTVFWPVSHYLSLGIGWAETHAGLCSTPPRSSACRSTALVLQDAQGREAAGHMAADIRTSPAARTARPQAMALFAAALALNGLVFSSISAHAVPLFDGLGFRGDEAVFMAALIGPSQVASRIGEILMGRRLTPMQLGLIAFGLLPVALALFAAAGLLVAGGAGLRGALWRVERARHHRQGGGAADAVRAARAMARCWASSRRPTSFSMRRHRCSSRCCSGVVSPQAALLIAGAAASPQASPCLAGAASPTARPAASARAKPPPARKVAAEP